MGQLSILTTLYQLTLELISDIMALLGPDQIVTTTNHIDSRPMLAIPFSNGGKRSKFCIWTETRFVPNSPAADMREMRSLNIGDR